MLKYTINPGDLRYKITFQSASTEQNKYGEPVEEYADVLTCRAGVYPISGREFFAAETTNSEVTHKIKMRYVSNIKPDMRIKFKDRCFNIISVINYQEKNVELQILCKELL